eukprot:jgi/Tetstr1/433305/TSEL_022592.t1
MAHFDYQLELEARLAEDEGGAMPDAEAAFEILANHRIREAMAAGEFDDLPGKGAPLRDRTDETTGDFSLKVLKNANVLPEWVELGKALRGRLSGVHAAIEPFVREVLEARPHSLAEALRRLKANPDWAAARAGLEADLETINRAIARHNALTPSAAVHMFPVRLDAAVSAMYKRLQQGAVEQRNAGS